jgi:Ring finger domain
MTRWCGSLTFEKRAGAISKHPCSYASFSNHDGWKMDTTSTQEAGDQNDPFVVMSTSMMMLLECPICLSGIIESKTKATALTMTTCCQNIFCTKCLEEHVTTSATTSSPVSCPTCRQTPLPPRRPLTSAVLLLYEAMIVNGAKTDNDNGDDDDDIDDHVWKQLLLQRDLLVEEQYETLVALEEQQMEQHVTILHQDETIVSLQEQNHLQDETIVSLREQNHRLQRTIAAGKRVHTDLVETHRAKLRKVADELLADIPK